MESDIAWNLVCCKKRIISNNHLSGGTEKKTTNTKLRHSPFVEEDLAPGEQKKKRMQPSHDQGLQKEITEQNHPNIDANLNSTTTNLQILARYQTIKGKFSIPSN